MTIMRRMWADVKARRHLDTYVAISIAIVVAVLEIVGDIVPQGIKWSALFAALGILLFRITLPDRPGTPVDRLLGDRTAFADVPFRSLLDRADQLWIFAPSAINMLNPQHCEDIRQCVLDKRTGDVRVAVLDPDNAGATNLAIRQLDESLEYPTQDFKTSLNASVEQLHRMAAWQTAGSFSYGFVDYNPGFSIVAINPTHRNGRVIVELHGYHNEAIGSRMHLTLDRTDNDYWFQYWVHQFEEIWTSSRRPALGSRHTAE